MCLIALYEWITEEIENEIQQLKRNRCCGGGWIVASEWYAGALLHIKIITINFRLIILLLWVGGMANDWCNNINGHSW